MFDFTQHIPARLRRFTTRVVSAVAHSTANATPQSLPMPGTAQTPNSAGGYTWALDHWARLDRFLVLGTEGGTYYVSAATLTREHATAAEVCIREDGVRVVRRVIEVSRAGRAATNDPALFILAMAAGIGDNATRSAALEALPEVARTGTHLFHWLQFVKAFRGSGRGVRTAVARWYSAKPANALAYQVLKYQSRDGWSHRDALRLAHPKAPSIEHEAVFRFVAGGWQAVAGTPAMHTDIGERIEAVWSLRGMAPATAARVIRVYRLTREMIPSELLIHAEVWEALLDTMPLTAMVRNLGVMTKIGLLTPDSVATRTVVERLQDRNAIRRARVHPLALLTALKTYATGRGVRGTGVWQPVTQVIDALDSAFYASFENAGTTGKRVMLALDVSGSMVAPVHGVPSVSCREASAAMAMITAAREPAHRFVAFTSNGVTRHVSWHGRPWPGALTPLSISPRQRLDDVVRMTSTLPFGGTDCALPMVEARKHRWAVDAFVIYTDNETWAGSVHPVQALREYRERMGIVAKLVVVAMASNGFSIADPNDAGMLDVVGFDTATPAVIGDFLAV